MSDSVEMSEIFKASPQEIFRDWIDSEGHTRMTGSPAHVDAQVGGSFDAWEGYISGRTLELVPGRRIVQAWRTTEFPEEAPDSRLEVRLLEVDGGTEVTLTHTDIPDGQGESYRQGWQDNYFAPMRRYYGS